MATQKKYKRVKKIMKESPNPLFEKWVQEWYDEAATKGWKSQYNYKKALQTLKKYPLPLNSGKEAQVLENFGVKICQMLDDKLKEFVKNGGDLPTELNGDRSKSSAINGDSSSDETCESQGQTRKTARKREYVPVVRSGPYALLVSLYKNHELNGANACMKKGDLMDAAQPLSDKSFRVPEPGCYYTAWSSMGVLIKKCLIVKESSPAKYSLTESGKHLAAKILNAENRKTSEINENSREMNVNSREINVNSREMNVNSQSSSSSSRLISTQSSTSSKNSENRFTYCYVTDGGEEVREKDKAAISVDADMIGFLVKCGKETLLSSGRCFKMDKSRPAADDFVYAFLHNNYADEIIDEEDFLNKISNSQSSDFSLSNQFCLRPDQYDIVLCVDNCETASGEPNSRRLMVQNDLRKNGVTFDIRKLHVGDYAWIAREKVALVPGQLRLPRGRELVLDYVVERKRMDDLAGSIKDGRFHEQKFRLKECGLRHPIYLVEDFGATSLPESTLIQAVSNTQVIDGFLIKQTKNVSESVTFLTIMTRYLQSLYSTKTLKSCSKEMAATKPITSNLFMTFEEFNTSSMKNKDLTVRDVFVKQLLQLQGLSIDKAVAIIEKYSTPSSLIEAYKQCESEKEKENLLSNLKFGLNKRNVGPLISKTFYRFYTQSSLV